MPEQKPRRARWWHLLGLLGPFVLLLASALFLLSLKLAGYYFLLIPARLGLVRLVTPAEIWKVDLRSAAQPRVVLTHPGLYAAYSIDTAILTYSDRLCEEGSAPRFRVQAEASGETLPLSCVERGMALYDTPFAAGRPFYTFEVTAPGTYLIAYPSQQGILYIVPDYTTGHETTIVLSYLVEFLILLIPSGLVIYQLLRDRQARVQRITDPQKQRRKEADAVWQAMAEQRQGKGKDEAGGREGEG